jgi:hypothetical protein
LILLTTVPGTRRTRLPRSYPEYPAFRHSGAEAHMKALRLVVAILAFVPCLAFADTVTT